MLASLIHARAAMAEQERQRLDHVRERFRSYKIKSRTSVIIDYEKHKISNINLFDVQYQLHLKELSRIIAQVENRIGWQAMSGEVPEDPGQ